MSLSDLSWRGRARAFARHRLARGPALRPPARALPVGAGAAAGLALHLRRRLPGGARPVDHAALPDLRALRGLRGARARRDDPALQRPAVLALDGLRPRDRGDADAAGQPVPALVPADREAARRRRGLDPAGLRLPRHRLGLGHPPAAAGLSHRAAGAGALGHDARRRSGSSSPRRSASSRTSPA